MVRPIPHRLIRPETVTISPIDTAATVDGFARSAMDHDARLADVVIPCQLEYKGERLDGSPLPGTMKRMVIMAIIKRICDGKGYTPHTGDLVTNEAFVCVGSSGDRLYISSKPKHVEGQGYLCELMDKAPTRRS